MHLDDVFALKQHAETHGLGGADRLQLDSNQVDVDGFSVQGAFDEDLNGLYLPNGESDGKTQYTNSNGFYWKWFPEELRWKSTNEAGTTEYYYSQEGDTDYPWESTPYTLGEDGVGEVTEVFVIRARLNHVLLRQVIATGGGGVTRWEQLEGKPTTFPPVIGAGAGDAVAGNDFRLPLASTAVQPAALTDTLTLARNFTGSEQPQFIVKTNDSGNFVQQFPADGSATIVWRYLSGIVALLSDITKAAVGLGNVENTALSTWTGSANITTLGTLGALALADGATVSFAGSSQSSARIALGFTTVGTALVTAASVDAARQAQGIYQGFSETDQTATTATPTSTAVSVTVPAGTYRLEVSAQFISTSPSSLLYNLAFSEAIAAGSSDRIGSAAVATTYNRVICSSSTVAVIASAVTTGISETMNAWAIVVLPNQTTITLQVANPAAAGTSTHQRGMIIARKL